MEHDEKDVWRPVKYGDYGEMYEVSRYGGEIRRRDSKTLRRTWLHKNGYRCISLSLSGQTLTEYVHRLVALTFCENPDPERFTQVSHLDENKTNNDASNLVWTDALHNNLYGTHIAKQVQTLAENRERARRKKMGKKVPVCILRPEPDGGVSGQTFESIAEACRKTGVKRPEIKAVCEGIRRTAKGFRWVYAYTEDELSVIRRGYQNEPEDSSKLVLC